MPEIPAPTELAAPIQEGTSDPLAPVLVTPPNESTPKTEIPKEVAAALHKANKEAETLRLKLKEFEDRDKTDAQKLLEERDALKTERDLLMIENVRRDVAAETGLNPALTKYLTGTTRDELEISAKELASFTPPPKPKFGDVGLGEGTREVGGSGRVYTQAEISNHQFYLANKADILLASKEGRIN